jgi:CPA1 family monovalent cation:H+ antiporter
MGEIQVFIAALLVSVALLNALANWWQVPYPIVLVLGGLALGLVPGIPEIELDPDLVLLIFLPPLLYSGAFFADLNALRNDTRVISLLSIGLVLATAIVVGTVAHFAFDLPWAVAIALGAIVGPTDPVAATTILRRSGIPRRIVNVLEGESLVNDASALVIYKVAVVAAVGAGFSLAEAGGRFLLAAGGGLAIGLLAGYLIAAIRRRTEDPTTEITISLFSGYAAFLPADEIGASGVLAAVTCGIYLGWLLNATLFILIGLQLPVIVDGLKESGISAGEAIADGLLVAVLVVVTRIVWSFGVTALIRAVDRRPQQRERRASWKLRVVAAWSGMRGAVSLAAALALPLTTDAGEALPGRDLILFITFAVILFTVVGQGLTLPLLIRRFDVAEDGSEEEHEEVRARLTAAGAALERLDELSIEEWTQEDTVKRVRAMYEFRRRRFKVLAGKIEDEDGIQDRSLAYQRLMHELYAAQRGALVELRDSGGISAEVMRRVERDLDLEEERLEV